MFEWSKVNKMKWLITGRSSRTWPPFLAMRLSRRTGDQYSSLDEFVNKENANGEKWKQKKFRHKLTLELTQIL